MTLCVVLGACSSGGASDTAAPSVVESTVAVAPTVSAPSSTALVVAPSTSVLGPGPTDEEIQQILTDLDRREAEIFAAFKKSLAITPEIEAMIVSSFGPGADQFRSSVRSHVADGGEAIQVDPLPPRTTSIEVVSRSAECFVVEVRRSMNPMLNAPEVDTYLLFRRVADSWFRLGELNQSNAEGFRGGACDLV